MAFSGTILQVYYSRQRHLINQGKHISYLKATQSALQSTQAKAQKKKNHKNNKSNIKQANNKFDLEEN